MYIFDFFKSLLHKSKIGVLIWMVLNAFIVTFVLGAIFASGGTLSDWASLLIGFLFYLASLAVALSPVGEWIVRTQQGCKKITDPAILQRLEPLFKEVHNKAIAQEPNLDRNIQLFMSDEEAPNAFATGRNTVCVTKGLLTYTDDEIKATLAHEFGHLANKDTDTLLIVLVGNMIVNGFFIVYRLLCRVMMWIITLIVSLASRSAVATIIASLNRFLVDVILSLLMGLWTRLGTLLCLASSRANEYKADEFACKLGFGQSLCNVLQKLGRGEKSRGLWATLNSTHPKMEKRLEKIRSNGALVN